MGKSAIKKSRRKSQREAARLQEQTDAVLTMEEDEEVLFKRPKIVPDTPRASRGNTPDPDDHLEEPKDYTAVLQMVKTVRDQLTALVLDNTNIVQHTTSLDHARKDVPPIGRRRPYSGLTARASGGRLGSVTSEQWPMSRDGIRTSELYRWSRT